MKPLKPENEPWIMRDDVELFLLFNAPLILLASILLNWRIALLLLGATWWDLGWHQNQHTEHRARRHVHIPLRIAGGIITCGSIYLLRTWIGRL